ncbi:hypothetical protein CLV63_111149 [Murinocardiopsis flavida]|uniref:DUF2000 family protein n=1 Tax=Murinocardiopsis flavida TaxID=645275 RepID=A0A2P8DH59_9ACTN|nr:DUF2000 domain-containing protein [Murinocardiopsis flavida]PSK96554.1 hypothetical protein CLV63_111149 [Murinocardiopsis flavida]
MSQTAPAETMPAAFTVPDDVGALDQPTRSQKLRWAIVVDRSLPAGLAANAAACMAAAVGKAAPGLVGPDAADGAGDVHSGLPWTGCLVLAADGDQLQALRGAATRAEGVLVVDMPRAAQATSVYNEYLDAMAHTGHDEVEYLAVSVVGPRNRIAKLVGRLPLLR